MRPGCAGPAYPEYRVTHGAPCVFRSARSRRMLRSRPRAASNWTRCASGVVVSLALVGGQSGTAFARASDHDGHLPTFAELQDAGAIVGRITINNQNVFDLEDPEENNFLFRAANALHIKTQPSVIQNAVLFKSGEPVSVRLIEETERLLRCNSYLYDVSIRPIAYHDGVVDIEISTRDTWTLDPGISFSRAGGSNSTGISLSERNLLGTGVSLGLSRTSDVDRSGTDFRIGYAHAFDGWTQLGYSNAKFDDGDSQAVTIARPFYSLDTRWGAGFTAAEDNRIDSIYTAGEIVGQYRHRQKLADLSGGLSRGLVDGWTQRYSLGLTYRDDEYEREPTLIAPARLPPDQTIAAPYLRYEVIEDGYRKFKNRNQIGRAEYFSMGFHSKVQVGRAFRGLGSNRELWIYSASAQKGFDLFSQDTLLTTASFSGQYGDGRVERQFLGGSAQYFRPHNKRALFYASVSGGVVRNPQLGDELLLGGDNGLRGYPLRYQAGEHRALLTLEERVYTDWYPFRLFRVGGAVFFDVGRSWGGDLQNPSNSGWLADAGFGLRILSCRSAFGTVLHADVAFPLNATSDIQSVQFLLRSKASF